MKKRILIIMCILLASLTLVGCNAGMMMPIIVEPWTYITAPVDSDGYFHEKTEYRVEMDKNYKYSELSGVDEYQMTNESKGVYTSIIRWKESKATQYEILTTFTFTGKYQSKDKSYISEEFTDTRSTKAIMATGATNFSPIESERTSSISYVYTKEDKPALGTLKYQEKLSYDSSKKTASGTMYMFNDATSKYDLAVPQSLSYPQSTSRRPTEYSFKKLQNALIFDNNAVFYVLRALDKLGTSSDYSQELKYVNIEGNAFMSAQFASIKSDADNIFTPIVYEVDGKSITKAAVKSQLGYSGDKTGTPITLWFSNSTLDNGNKPKQLLKMQQNSVLFFLEKINDTFISDEN